MVRKLGPIATVVMTLMLTAGTSAASRPTTTSRSTTTTKPTRARASASEVTDLPFPVAYTTAGDSNGHENVWVAGDGRLPTRVGPTEFLPSLDWSDNGRYLVTVVNAYSSSSSVERYDDATGSIKTWRCGGCDEAVVIGKDIVAVDSKLQLLRFPLSGGSAEPPHAISGMPGWSRSPFPRFSAIPDAVGGTNSAVLLTWPIFVGASNVWGTYVLVTLDGRYLRTVVSPGKSKAGVSLTGGILTGGVVMAFNNRSALVSENYEISACEEAGKLARLSLTKPGNVTYPNPPGPAGTDAYPISFAIDSAGNTWAVFTATKWATPPENCSDTPAQLYRWNEHRWAVKSKDVLGVAFGPQGQMVVIAGHLRPRSARWSRDLGRRRVRTTS
jgi:hypothetical protein